MSSNAKLQRKQLKRKQLQKAKHSLIMAITPSDHLHEYKDIIRNDSYRITPITKGRVRDNTRPKMINYASRGIITSDTQIPINTISLPIGMYKNLVPHP